MVIIVRNGLAYANFLENVSLKLFLRTVQAYGVHRQKWTCLCQFSGKHKPQTVLTDSASLW